MSGKTSGQIKRWNFPCLSLPFSSKIGTIVDPKGFFELYFFAEDLYIKQKVPNRNGNFTVKSQILITPIKYDRFIKKVFEYKNFRWLTLGLPTAVPIKIKSEMNFVNGILADLISENIVLVDDSLQVDTKMGFLKVFDGEELHLLYEKV